MASHSYILRIEDALKDNVVLLQLIKDAFENESTVNGGELYPENVSLWQNVTHQLVQVQTLLTEINNLPAVEKIANEK